jgi:hypothetical protein
MAHVRPVVLSRRFPGIKFLLLFFLSLGIVTQCCAEQFRQHCLYDWTWKRSDGREFGVQVGHLVDLYSDSPKREFPILVDIMWGSGSWNTTLNQLMGLILLVCLGLLVSFFVLRRFRSDKRLSP